MKHRHTTLIIFLLLAIFTISCSQGKKSDPPSFSVDLDNMADAIQYSQFVKSLDYIELNTNDSCIISGVKNIFLDDDTLIMLDEKKAGILIFTSEGKLINQINHYGNSPEELIKIMGFTIDPILNHIYALDIMSQKINTYNYKGEFIESKKTTLYIRDFAVLKDEIFLCILPFYSENTPYGIWITDNNNNFIKIIKCDIPKDDQFEFGGSYTNRSGEGMYYYDRNWDNFSYLTKDTALVLYQINLKQRLKEDVRKREPETIKLEDFAMMSSFSNSDKFLLISYYYYVEKDPYRWAFYNKETQKVTTSATVLNDMDYVQSSSNQIFYLNDSTWCRVLDDEENICNIQLQIMNLK